MSFPRNERRQAHERKRYTSYRIGIVGRGNDLAAAQDEPEPQAFAKPEDATPADAIPYGYAYGSMCGRCGGTPTGRSHRGFVGVCACPGEQR